MEFFKNLYKTVDIQIYCRALKKKKFNCVIIFLWKNKEEENKLRFYFGAEKKSEKEAKVLRRRKNCRSKRKYQIEWRKSALIFFFGGTIIVVCGKKTEKIKHEKRIRNEIRRRSKNIAKKAICLLFSLSPRFGGKASSYTNTT